MWSLINRIDNEKRTLSIQGSGRGESATGTEAGGRAARRTQGWPGERLLKGRRVLQRHSGACRVGEDWTVPAALKHTPPVTVAGSGLAELTGQKPDGSKWRGRGIKGAVYRQRFCKLVCEAEERNKVELWGKCSLLSLCMFFYVFAICFLRVILKNVGNDRNMSILNILLF